MPEVPCTKLAGLDSCAPSNPPGCKPSAPIPAPAAFRNCRRSIFMRQLVAKPARHSMSFPTERRLQPIHSDLTGGQGDNREFLPLQNGGSEAKLKSLFSEGLP